MSKQTGSKEFRRLGLQKWALMGVSTESDQERDACRAQSQEFKIETCLAVQQTKITGCATVRIIYKEKLGKKLISGVTSETRNAGRQRGFHPTTSSEVAVFFWHFLEVRI